MMSEMKKFIKRFSPQQYFLFSLPFAFGLAVVILALSSQSYLKQKTCGCSSTEAVLSGDFDYNESRAYFNNQPVVYPLAMLDPLRRELAWADESILGVSDDERWLEVDLSEQKIYAREGDRVAYQFLISSGKPWTPTVTGEFRIWIKLRYTKMSGGSRELGNYYYLPNVPYVQYFHGDYGLHGAYWHNNFGQTMSHGCVNLSVLDSEKLFYWTSPYVPPGKNVVRATSENPGTRIVVHD